MKRSNRSRILDCLRADGPAGAADLAAATGLSVATCAGLAAALVADGAAVELPARESTGGRPGRRYAHNPERFFIAALAVEAVRGGDATVSCTLADADGTVVEDLGATTATALPETIDRILDEHRARRPALRAAAVSVPGVVQGGVVGLCDAPELTGLALARRLEARHGLKAAVDNDVNFAALGRGAGKGAPADLAFLYFPEDNWPGAGLLVNGALVRGRSSFAGEVSFLPLPENTRFADAAREVPGAAGSPRPYADPERAALYIARILGCVAAVVNPEVVVLSGGAVRESMLPAVRRFCRTVVPAEHLPELEFCADFAALRFAGMAAAARDRVFDGEDAR